MNNIRESLCVGETCVDYLKLNYFFRRLIRVVVLDRNDNAPVFFKSSFSFFFPENTFGDTTVVVLNATDRDAGRNGAVRYSMDEEEEDFSLDARTGLLSVRRRLDRERREFYDLRVRATDRAVAPDEPLSSVAVVRIRVLVRQEKNRRRNIFALARALLSPK